MFVSSVEQIERAIEQLSPSEFSEIARWVLAQDQKRWDDQMDRDAASGQLDFLREEAMGRAGRVSEELALTSRVSKQFWRLLAELPVEIQRLAEKNHRLWVASPDHPSLHFRKLRHQNASTNFA